MERCIIYSEHSKMGIYNNKSNVETINIFCYHLMGIESYTSTDVQSSCSITLYGKRLKDFFKVCKISCAINISFYKTTLRKIFCSLLLLFLCGSSLLIICKTFAIFDIYGNLISKDDLSLIFCT